MEKANHGLEHNEIVELDENWQTEIDNDEEIIVTNSAFLSDSSLDQPTLKRNDTFDQNNNQSANDDVLEKTLNTNVLSEPKRENIDTDIIETQLKRFFESLEKLNEEEKQALLNILFNELQAYQVYSNKQNEKSRNQDNLQHSQPQQPSDNKEKNSNEQYSNNEIGLSVVDSIGKALSATTQLGANGIKFVADTMQKLAQYSESRKKLVENEEFQKSIKNISENIVNINSTDNRHNSIPSNIQYRLEGMIQAEKAYQENLNILWQEPSLFSVRKRIMEMSEEQNIPIPNIIQKMNQDPSVSELTDAFNKAVADSDEVQQRIKKIDNSLESWMDFHSSLTDDFCYLDAENETLKKAFSEYEKSEQNMQEITQFSPKNEESEQSDFLKLKEYMEKIKEQIKEFVTKVKNFFSNITGSKPQDSNEHTI